jgi:hypothetical protein
MTSCGCGKNTSVGDRYSSSYREPSKYISLWLYVNHRKDIGKVVCEISNFTSCDAENVELYYENISDNKDGQTVLLAGKTIGTISLGDIGEYYSVRPNKVKKELEIDFKKAVEATFKFTLYCNGQPLSSTETEGERIVVFSAPPVSLQITPISSFDLIGGKQEIQFKIEPLNGSIAGHVDISKVKLIITNILSYSSAAFISKQKGGPEVEELTGSELGKMGDVITLFINPKECGRADFRLELKYDERYQYPSKSVSWTEEGIDIFDVSDRYWPLSKTEKSIELINRKGIIDPNDFIIELISNNAATFTFIDQNGVEVGSSAALYQLIGTSTVRQYSATKRIQFKLADAHKEYGAEVTVVVKCKGDIVTTKVIKMQWGGPDIALFAASSSLLGRAKKMQVRNYGNAMDSKPLTMELSSNNAATFTFIDQEGRKLGSKVSLDQLIGSSILESHPFINYFTFKLDEGYGENDAQVTITLKLGGVKVTGELVKMYWKNDDDISIDFDYSSLIKAKKSFRLFNYNNNIEPNEFTIELTSNNAATFTLVDKDGKKFGASAKLSQLIGSNIVDRFYNTDFINFQLDKQHGQTNAHVTITVKCNDVALATLSIDIEWNSTSTDKSKLTVAAVNKLKANLGLQQENTFLAMKLLRFAQANQKGEEIDINEILVGGGKSQKGTVLHEAVLLSKFSKELMDLLLESGADIAAQNVLGYTPLHSAIEVGNIEAVKYLLAANAPVNVQAKEDGYTPMHVAVVKAHTEIVKLLLEKNPDLSLKSKKKVTALNMSKTGGNLEIEKLLLAYQSKRRP